MSRYSESDPYLDPATGVLKNRLGITDQATLEETEAALVATRSLELSEAPLKGNFDLVHLQAIHRLLFGDVYEWAGELRTIDVSKGRSMFAHHRYVESALRRFSQNWRRKRENATRIHRPSGAGERLHRRMGKRQPTENAGSRD